MRVDRPQTCRGHPAPSKRTWRQRLSGASGAWVHYIHCQSCPGASFMRYSREPRLHPVPVISLRPTQITVGMREVKAKRKSWREHPDRKKPDFLGNHMIPVIWGPKGDYYVIDHHHLSLALHQEGVKHVMISVTADLRRLTREAFWVYLDNRGWLHPFDEHGRRRTYDDVPRRLADLVDDPYRSLAGELRRSGGFAKDTTPF